MSEYFVCELSNLTLTFVTVWKAGKVYEFDYKGFIATGMFGLSPKTSGGSIEGRLVVEPVDESTVNVAVSP